MLFQREKTILSAKLLQAQAFDTVIVVVVVGGGGGGVVVFFVRFFLLDLLTKLTDAS